MRAPDSRDSLITRNGVLTEVGRGVERAEWGVQGIPATLVVRFRDDAEHALAHRLRARGAGVTVVGRSSLAQLDIEIAQAPGTRVHFDGQVRVPVRIQPLSGIAREYLAEDLPDALADGQPEAARLRIALPRAALDARQVAAARDRGDLDIDPEAVIDREGVIWMPVRDIEYALRDEALRGDPVRDVLREGRPALKRLLAPRRLRRDVIPPGDVLVGAIRAYSERYTFVIERQTNYGDAFHLSPYVLDGNRQDGHFPEDYRLRHKQVEVANVGKEPIPIERLRIGMRVSA